MAKSGSGGGGIIMGAGKMPMKGMKMAPAPTPKKGGSALGAPKPKAKR